MQRSISAKAVTYCRCFERQGEVMNNYIFQCTPCVVLEQVSLAKVLYLNKYQKRQQMLYDILKIGQDNQCLK
jgi:hypothetical protein